MRLFYSRSATREYFFSYRSCAVTMRALLCFVSDSIGTVTLLVEDLVRPMDCNDLPWP